MSSPSKELIISVSADCYFVKMTSYHLNVNFVLNLRADFVLQSIITLAANSLCINVLLGCVFGLSVSSCLCFLLPE